jgi:hypothetical protein
VISSLLPDVNLAQWDSVLCELRFIVSGGPGGLSLSPGTVPFGVSLGNAQETINVDGVSPAAFNRLTKTPAVLPITSRGNFVRTGGFAMSLMGARTTRCDQAPAPSI